MIDEIYSIRSNVLHQVDQIFDSVDSVSHQISNFSKLEVECQRSGKRNFANLLMESLALLELRDSIPVSPVAGQFFHHGCASRRRDLPMAGDPCVDLAVGLPLELEGAAIIGLAVRHAIEALALNRTEDGIHLLARRAVRIANVHRGTHGVEGRTNRELGAGKLGLEDLADQDSGRLGVEFDRLHV